MSSRASLFARRPASGLPTLVVGQALSVSVLVWELVSSSLSAGVWAISLLAALAFAGAVSFAGWRSRLLRAEATSLSVALTDRVASRAMTRWALLYGAGWVLVCIHIHVFRDAPGLGFEVLLLTLQVGIFLSSLFHVDGPLRRVAWALLGMQILCMVGIAVWTDELHRMLPEIVAACAFLVLGYAIATARAREQNHVLQIQRERNEEKGFLVQQVAHLQEAHGAKARLLAMVSHDLRQPVHALGLMLGRLRREASLSSLRVEVEAVNEVVNSLSKSLTMLMAVTRLNSGQVTTLTEPISLDRLFSSLANEFQETASATGLNISFEAHDLNVLTDPNHLRTILTNLLSNAIKYSSRGTVRMEAISPIPQTVVISVKDNGVGIPESDLTRIFEPFLRLSNSRGSADGIGLGLAIVKQTAELIKAPIEVASVVGQGTTFSISLPRCENLQAASAPSTETYLKGARIVVVDNDEIVLTSMALTLEEWGCRVIAASDWSGLEAKLEMTVSPIDLVLTDFHLDAGLSGYELIKRIRKRQGAQIPAILLTGDVEIRHGPESTAAAVVIAYKPLPYEKLSVLIQETISAFRVD